MCHHATCVKEKTETHLYIQSMEKVSSAVVCRATALRPLATRVPALCLEASVSVDRDTLGILKLAFMTLIFQVENRFAFSGSLCSFFV